MFGETQPETRRWNLKGWRPGEIQQENLWTADCTAALKNIVDEEPQLFLDEIRLSFLHAKGQLWSTSHLWEVLTVQIGWSLQVATVSAGQRDDEQLQPYMAALDAWAIDPRQLLHLDETHKDRNAARRRRHWSLRNKTPEVSATFVGSHFKR